MRAVWPQRRSKDAPDNTIEHAGAEAEALAHVRKQDVSARLVLDRFLDHRGAANSNRLLTSQRSAAPDVTVTHLMSMPTHS
jgi:hypothetical protein